MIGIKKLSALLLGTQLLFATGSSTFSATQNYDESSSEKTHETTTESTKKLELHNSISATLESQTSASSEEQVIAEEQVADSSTKESESKDPPTKQSVSRAVGVQASGSGTSEGDPRIVDNSAELKTAIEDPQIAYIKLAPSEEIFYFDVSSPQVRSNVTIDGSGRTISYNKNTLEVRANNVWVKFMNMTFGSPDYSVTTNEYYGLCRGYGNSNVTVEVENVTYYSRIGAQPFHNHGDNSKIVFSGKNFFSVQDGSSDQEFAECNHFLFKKDSHTTVDHATGYYRAILTDGDDFSFELEDGATVDFDTTTEFINSYDSGTIKVGQNAELKINGSKRFVVSSNEPTTFEVDEGGKLDLTFASKFNFSNTSTFNFAKDSTLSMAVTNANQIFSRTISADNFIINNAYRLSFNVSGSTNKEPVNAGFTFSEFIPGITGYGITAGNTPIKPIIGSGAVINSNGTDFTLNSPQDFETEQKTTIRGARSIVLQRLPNPAVILDVKQVVKDTSAVFNLTDYLTNNNVITGVDYLLFSKQQDTESFNDTDKIAEQKIEAKAEEAGEAGEATELTEAEITSSVEFTDLTEQTEYWLYVQIKAGFASGDSEWYEISFTTKTDALNVTFPTEMFFNTEMSEADRRLLVTSQRYRVKNNSAYPIELKINSFSEDGVSGVDLLENIAGDTKGHLYLQLAKDSEGLTTLTKDTKDVDMGELDIDQQINLQFTGEYFGNAGKEINTKYNMILEFTRTGE
ncbi:pectate lyase-like adhesive domain-containing protein [Enterococcus canintestini]|uniref:WxL domain-containing protein n=1 Tax=Enterococcus canintestini TaxID=317010 RepID=A0A267HQ86_9ENTE|nr:pectate lyase-like adhesive domain-containing protein [Enterococcus canintestini]PAB00504.1 hypothetical protein AKL21_08415 [Enterococcus canintestini]